MYLIWSSVLMISKIIAQQSEDSTVSVDLALCTCDLTSLSCDVNCCCDNECSPSDRLVFTRCDNVLHSNDDKMCIQPDEIFLNNSKQITEINQDGLLCIYKDNYEDRYKYTEPESIETEEDFLAYKKKYANLDLESENSVLQRETKNLTVGENYRIGDPVLMITENVVLIPVTLPSSLFSGFCAGMSPVQIFKNSDHICKMTVKNLSDSCVTNHQLSARYYFDGLKLLRSPNLLNTLLESLPIDAALATLNPNDNFLEFDVSILGPEHEKSGSLEIANVPEPNWNEQSEMCQNVVTQVSYHFRMNATAGIVSAKAQITLNSIQSVSFDQRFASHFTWAIDQSHVMRRSGNPGYHVGEPVMAGTVYQVLDTEEQSVLVDLDRNKWLTVIASNDCNDSTKRAPILFGHNMQSGCLIELSMDTSDSVCQTIQDSILKALKGDVRTQVAAYANASFTNVGDWVNILVENPPKNEARSSGQGACTLIVGLEIEIIFANTNSISNPQAKIIGVVYRYQPHQDLSIQCVGPYCTESGRNLKQKFPVITTVTFVDVSRPVEPKMAVVPTIDMKLPYDFFYPFTGSATSVSLTLSLLSLSLAFSLQN